MHINIAHIGSDEWFNYKSDIIYGLFHSLNRIGHQTTITHNKIEKGKTNIIIGADWLTQASSTRTFLSLRADYFIYEIEAFTGTSINHRDGVNMQNYSDIISGAIGVITPYQYNVRSYSLTGFGEKIFYAPWGHYDEIVDNNILRHGSMEYDGIFYGMPKGERATTIARIKERLKDRFTILDRSSPHLIRAYCLSKSKYALSISYGVAEYFVNPFRIQFLLSNGIPVISNNKEDADGYLRSAFTVETDALCERLLESPPPQPEVLEKSRMVLLKDGL
ncbi:MAG: hypothetical protein PHT19_08655, partial [Methylococcus sp.]|nr:hypothetical protein [Methylococcus sp.]